MKPDMLSHQYHFYILSFRRGEAKPFFTCGVTGHKPKARLLKRFKREHPRARHIAIKCTSPSIARYGDPRCNHA